MHRLVKIARWLVTPSGQRLLARSCHASSDVGVLVHVYTCGRTYLVQPRNLKRRCMPDMCCLFHCYGWLLPALFLVTARSRLVDVLVLDNASCSVMSTWPALHEHCAMPSVGVASLYVSGIVCMLWWSCIKEVFATTHNMHAPMMRSVPGSYIIWHQSNCRIIYSILHTLGIRLGWRVAIANTCETLVHVNFCPGT